MLVTIPDTGVFFQKIYFFLFMANNFNDFSIHLTHYFSSKQPKNGQIYITPMVYTHLHVYYVICTYAQPTCMYEYLTFMGHFMSVFETLVQWQPCAYSMALVAMATKFN